MSERKILPCPFCGEKAKTFHIPENDKEEMKNHPKWKWKHPGMWVIGCDTEMCMGNIGHFAMIFETEEDAIKTWNTRKPMEKVVDRLKDVAIERYGYDSGMGGERVVNLDDAIEIVKQVGAGTDDVCEWKSTSNGEFIQNPHTNRLLSNEPSMKNVHCNTCGKKIKVVE